ncbi:alpha-D-ribose 1-methylphosphonate 5-triphosphate diphosphatase [uncultured Cohaesibacter sp.]|uniref:alpha-D-ribose 1-methylphosphonate 5-triphosphate diphosphatase n=1 Tax=uncultured Cohaesibacter sp. TaxID=1002546 RepID=UPI00292E10F6|nr:alpha-D-ribose 1-methylphosphonate 5-triphosphate diphosphatase [uncultured Cohaesibacter sp.]
MWLSNFRVILANEILDHGAIKIMDGKILEISRSPVSNPDIDGHGLLLMPGLIDLHGDMIEQEVEPRPQVTMPFELGIRDLDRRLKMSGITTAYASVAFNPAMSDGRLRSYEHSKRMLHALREMRNKLAVDHRVHARFEVNFPNAMSVIEELIADGTIDLVSLTDHTPGQGQFRDIERLIKSGQKKGMDREEAEAYVTERIRSYTEGAGDTLATIRSIAQTCHKAAIPLASHDDDTIEKVELMNEVGASISEFPVTTDAAHAAHALGLMNAMGAPNALRGQSYSGNLSVRQAHDEGLLDILMADYHPSSMLPAILILAKSNPEGLPGATRLASVNPAIAMGLTDRGEIAIDKRADLVIADDSGVGHVKATFVEGKPVYSEGPFSLATI